MTRNFVVAIREKVSPDQSLKFISRDIKLKSKFDLFIYFYCSNSKRKHCIV